MTSQQESVDSHINGTNRPEESGPTTHDKIREATEARDALAAALTRAGIQLPAMDVRAHPNRNDEPRYALVHLGACSAPVALALADVITQGAVTQGGISQAAVTQGTDR